MSYKVSNLKETRELAFSLASSLVFPQKIYLNGPLGSGKTQFSRYLLEYFKYNHVSSPSYGIINTYPISYQNLSTEFHHIDLYRLHHESELEDIGIEEILEKSDLCIVEWSLLFDLFQSFNHIKIDIEMGLLDERIFHISSPTIF